MKYIWMFFIIFLYLKNDFIWYFLGIQFDFVYICDEDVSESLSIESELYILFDSLAVVGFFVTVYSQ